MSNYRRNRVPGGTYFFTVNALDQRSSVFVEHIDLLREAVRLTRTNQPFHIDAWVVLPEHMHAVWTLPAHDDDYSGRWKSIKIAFSKSLPKLEMRPSAQVLQGERGIWQRRFWEHTIRDDADYATHVDYVHVNPLKHGLVTRVGDWPHSSFHRFVAKGVYPIDWAGDGVTDISAGER
jgi:putative transposase